MATLPIPRRRQSSELTLWRRLLHFVDDNPMTIMAQYTIITASTDIKNNRLWWRRYLETKSWSMGETRYNHTGRSINIHPSLERSYRSAKKRVGLESVAQYIETMEMFKVPSRNAVFRHYQPAALLESFNLYISLLAPVNTVALRKQIETIPRTSSFNTAGDDLDVQPLGELTKR